ncbi:MAG: hypothetical protein RIR15_627, partial [Actinomycetota bacterium]
GRQAHRDDAIARTVAITTATDRH